MNYLYIYEKLIEKRRTTPLDQSCYGENHHIIPVCMDGSDDKENIVRLTAKEHYIAHALLFKHYKTSKLAHAWWNMFRVSDGQDRKLNAAQFEMVKVARAKKMSEEMTGEGNHFFGKKHSEETRKLLSEQKTSKHVKLTSEEIEAWVVKIGARNPKSEEHKKKIGRKGLVMLQNIHTLKIIRVNPESYDPEVWVNPKKLKPDQKFKCECCGIETNKGNLVRWHNEKCKQKH